MSIIGEKYAKYLVRKGLAKFNGVVNHCNLQYQVVERLDAQRTDHYLITGEDFNQDYQKALRKRLSQIAEKIEQKAEYPDLDGAFRVHCDSKTFCVMTRDGLFWTGEEWTNDKDKSKKYYY